ncbi:uncharacterized protein LOC111917399 [Lactuca sativa]|uniref:uncharacterized protein LOC111917399 n=1 Tax=Lactuca sativa TaxID=4236 RepID=UPI000CC70710|nr:uncharacterized protein LOC111917399 [Lactuca sativa]XP_023768858.1 uncharacterized protein LOC111917399 [Lactuca sativa]XP_023768859.1 uncharacterized protein LOC111917399 [Lactuca sativa]
MDSTGDLETQNRFPSPPSFNISHDDDFDLTIVHETPRNDDNALVHEYEPPIVKETPIKNSYPATLESISESTIIQSKFPTRSFSSPCSTSASECMNTTTPKKQQIPQNNSPLDSSVNSHFHKRRKSSAFASVKMSQFDSPKPKPTFPVKETKKDLKISCSLCKNPLGLVENDYSVPCSSMSLSKMHLVSSWKGREKGGTSVAVVVSDIGCVDGRIWKRNGEEGIWSKEDGCVFNTAFCPFCSDQDNCLGLHVVATDSSNVQLLNKVLFYSDRLDIQHIHTSTTNKEESPSIVTSLSKSVLQNPFEKFAYTSPQTNSIGWRTTKSKMRLPKKVLASTTKY